MRLNKKNLPPTDGKWVYDQHVRCWHSELSGQLHNSLGPAYVSDFGLKIWFIDGLRHRLDGPAVERSDSSKEWWVNGQGVFEQDFPSAVISFLLDIDKKSAQIIVDAL